MIEAVASVPGSPVVTVPIVNVGVSASAPVAPVGPVEPYISVQNKQNIANKGNETRSIYTNFVVKW